MPKPQQMQVIGIENASLTQSEQPLPTPQANEVLIKTAYAGVNRADIFQVQGSYPPPEGVANIPGLEISGTVVATGENVDRWNNGDRVCALLEGCGYSEYVTANQHLCLPIPEPLSLKQAAAIPECAATIWLTMLVKANLQAGESVLVHGGSSGIGTTAIQMMKALGATIYVTAGSDEKCHACEMLGATAINYHTQDFVSCIKAQGGVDVVLDMVGGDYVARNMKCLNAGGRLISIALLGGANTSLKASSLLLKQLSWIGVTLRSQPLSVKANIMQSLHDTLWPWVASDQFTPVIDRVFPFFEADKAHEHMRKSLHIGKILLEVNAE